MGGPGYCIKGEFLFNGVDNNLKHKRGVLSMARAQSSELRRQPVLHHACRTRQHPRQAVCRVRQGALEGMDVVDAICQRQDRPQRPPGQAEQKMKSRPRRHKG